MKKTMWVLLFLVGGYFLMAKSYSSKHSTSVIDTSFIKYIDTNIIIYGANGAALRYHNYVDSLLDGVHFVMNRNGKLQLIKQLLNWPGDSARMVNINISAISPKSRLIPTWDRALIKNIPASLDTSVIVYDQDHEPLKFYQYFGMMLKGTGFYNVQNGKKQIYRFSEFRVAKPFLVNENFTSTDKKVANIYLQLMQADKVVVIKNKRRVYLQRAGKNVFEFSCNLGSSPVGDKQQDKDGKTPEGSYLMESKSTEVKYYKGFFISYPDSTHKAIAKQKGLLPGAGIMFHGTSVERSKRKDWTNGCIAVSNANMDTLFKYVMTQTPIEIKK